MRDSCMLCSAVTSLVRHWCVAMEWVAGCLGKAATGLCWNPFLAVMPIHSSAIVQRACSTLQTLACTYWLLLLHVHAIKPVGRWKPLHLSGVGLNLLLAFTLSCSGPGAAVLHRS